MEGLMNRNELAELQQEKMLEVTTWTRQELTEPAKYNYLTSKGTCFKNERRLADEVAVKLRNDIKELLMELRVELEELGYDRDFVLRALWRAAAHSRVNFWR